MALLAPATPAATRWTRQTDWCIIVPHIRCLATQPLSQMQSFADIIDRNRCLWFPEIRIWLIHWELSLIRSVTPASMLMATLAAVRDCLRTRAALQIEVLALRHPLSVLQRSVKRPKLTAADRFLWARLSRFWTDWRSALVIVKPETVIAWRRKGFRVFWT